jgi:site-specific recombinase XerD
VVFVSETYATRLTLAEAARMMRGAVKDKSYRATPVGLLVGRYLRWFRNEWGATATTIRDYEAVLARMSLTLADKDPLEVTVDDLRDVIDLWADREARTRAKVTSVVRAFWSWAEEQDQVPFSPAAKLRRPRAPRRAAPLLPQNADARLLNAAETLRDRVALLFLLDLGVRRSELAGVHPGDVDLSRRQVTVFGKGQKSRVIPLRGRIVLEIEHYLMEALPLVGRPPEPDDFILYPEKRSGGRQLIAAYPKKAMSPPTIHRWWYRHAEAAGLVGAGMTSGLNMHRARHTFATDLRRVADLGAASQALGHSDLSTTASIYGHYDLSDLENAMEALARSRREREEPAD